MTEHRRAIEHVAAGEYDPEHPVRFVVRWTVHTHHAKAEVFAASYRNDGVNPPVLSTIEPVDEPDVCDVTFKWDGCADWHFDQVSLHTCSADDVRAIAELMVHLRAQAEKLIPEFDHDVAD